LAEMQLNLPSQKT